MPTCHRPASRLSRLVFCGILLCIHAGGALADSWRQVGVRLQGERFLVEVAEHPAQQQLGLMHRSRLAPNAGMLFIFEPPQPVEFWMKDVRFSLDILYFDATGRLAEILADTPPCATPNCPGYPSKAEVRYVLEVNAGTAARLGLRPGTRLQIEPQN